MKNVRTLVLVAIVILVAGCGLLPKHGTASSPTTPRPIVTVTTTSASTPTPGAATYTFTGTAIGAGNQAISGVTVGLKLTTATAGCSDCGLYTAVTDNTGTYRMAVPDGVYIGACVAGKLTCRFTDAPNDATPKITISGGDLRANITISAPDNSTPTQAPDSGDVVSGHVYNSQGRPVAGATVEFRKAACPDCMPQPFTTTNSAGFYSITLDDGVYNAECPEDNCGVIGGDGGPYPVTVPPSKTVNFLECASPYNLAACLEKGI